MNGVNFDKKSKKWIVTFCYEQKKLYIGKYDTFEDAINARKNAENETYKNIKNIFKQKRLIMKLTQNEIAKQLNISRKTYNMFENGKSMLHKKTYDKLLKILEIKN